MKVKDDLKRFKENCDLDEVSLFVTNSYVSIQVEKTWSKKPYIGARARLYVELDNPDEILHDNIRLNGSVDETMFKEMQDIVSICETFLDRFMNADM